MKKSVLIVVALVLVFIGIPASVLAYRYWIAPWVGRVEKQEIVQSGEFQLYSYEHFYDMKASIETAEQSYISQSNLLKTLAQGTDEYQRVRQNIAAIEPYIIQLKAQYNADAAKEGSRGQFKAHDLPDSYPLTLPVIK